MRKKKPLFLDTTNELQFFHFEAPVAERRAVEASIAATRAGCSKCDKLLTIGDGQRLKIFSGAERFKHFIEKPVLVSTKAGETEDYQPSSSLVDPEDQQARK